MKYQINRYGCSKPMFRAMVIGYAMKMLYSSQSPKELNEALDALNKCIEDDEDRNLKQLRADLASLAADLEAKTAPTTSPCWLQPA